MGVGDPITRESAICVDHVVRVGDYAYPMYVRSARASWDEFSEKVVALRADRFFVIADDGVPVDSRRLAVEALCAVAAVEVITCSADEKRKNLLALSTLAEEVLKRGATRRSVIVALGGGTVGNVAGLLAALLFRGIRLVHVPTTLLSMSDSVLSLKQAVNSSLGKNHLGAFRAPELVWNYLPFIDSLAADEVRAALCEAIKNVLAICPQRRDPIHAALRSDGCYGYRALAEFIGMCVEAKCSVMHDDPYERGGALVLEYGHTVGHAAELLTGGELSHGFAIGIGMVTAARVAATLGYLSEDAVAVHLELLERNGAPTELPGLATADVVSVVGHDNKRGYVAGRADHHGLILLEGLGRPHREDGSLITLVPRDVLWKAVADTTSFSSPLLTV
jgi:3-dehydroquinate synthase/2-deoxy-scyllo-inosose synthase